MSTIYALSSGRPSAAIAVIRISGPQAHDAARRLCGTLPEPRLAAVRTLRHPASGEILDEALVLRFDAPATATGEDVVELHCHGSRAVVAAVLEVLEGVDNVRAAEPGEFTRRAFENGRIDLTEAEGLADLLEAETESQRKAALKLADGGLRKQIALWQERLLALSAMAERAIDYDEDDQAVDPVLTEACAALAGELEEWLQRPRVEPLKDGVRVVLAGPVNAGKSSLINAIAGYERVIVSPVAGTTRDHIEVPVSLDGVPLVLTDTAGLRETGDAIEATGVNNAQRLIADADILLWLGPSREMPAHHRAILIHPKIDIEPDAPVGALPVSSLTGAGIETMLRAIGDKARSMIPSEDALSLNRRQAAEMTEASAAMHSAAAASDAIIIAEELRSARMAFDRLTGRAGMEDVLDALFSRFCLGK